MGRAFTKMTGSGNDFVFFDARKEPAGELASPSMIRELCARGTGVGADGVVFLERSDESAFAIRYYNSDGSLAELCGNASLCSVRLGIDLGLAPSTGFFFDTGSGSLRGRLADGSPEIDMPAPVEVELAFETPLAAGERRIGFARVGVPHLVILCEEVDAVDVIGRGRPLRQLRQLRDGANANFVSRSAEHGWAIRTYERGVETETLACGTGAVAAATLLAHWGEADEPVTLVTRSGRPLTVRFRVEGQLRIPSLRGEGRIVFRGQLPDDG